MILGETNVKKVMLKSDKALKRRECEVREKDNPKHN